MIINGNIQAVPGAYNVSTASGTKRASAMREAHESDAVVFSSEAQSFSSMLQKLKSMDDSREQTARGGVGRLNRGEAALTIRVAEDYVQRIGKQRLTDEQIDIGIISPYRAQVHLLRHLVKQSAVLKPFRRAITVGTVDGFQGQERDVIIISMVRANDTGEIGFLRDLRRMNVAITRARSKLIIIGDASTLTRHAFYRRLHDSL